MKAEYADYLCNPTHFGYVKKQWKATLAFDQEYFQHAILLTSPRNSYSETTPKGLFDIRIYIGNSANPNKCTECPGSPFFTTASIFDSFGSYKYGDEIWCNLAGSYTHFVTSTQKKVAISVMAVMGNRYTRSVNPVTSDTVVAGSTFETSIGKLTAQMPLGNILDIGWRWKAGTTAPSYCSLVPADDGAQVTVQCSPTLSEPAGAHDLVVETFDKASSLGLANASALKTDTIALSVTAYVLPSLSNDLVDINWAIGTVLAPETQATVIAGSAAIDRMTLAITTADTAALDENLIDYISTPDMNPVVKF